MGPRTATATVVSLMSVQVETRFNPNHGKGGRFASGSGGGASVGLKVGSRHSFATGTEHGTGKTVTNFKGKVARKAPDGRLMVNTGTDAKPRWVETHAKHISAAPVKKAAAGESKRTYAQRLTPDERKAVMAYMSENFKGINGSLRRGEKPGAVTAKRIRDLDSAVAKGTIERDATLYRGFHLGDTDPRSLVGKTIRDQGFVSTSENAKLPLFMAASRKNGVYARVKVPAGTPAGYLHKVQNRQSVSKYDGVPEREVLLPRGSNFRVSGARQGADGMWTVDLELVAA